MNKQLLLMIALLSAPVYLVADSRDEGAARMTKKCADKLLKDAEHTKRTEISDDATRCSECGGELSAADQESPEGTGPDRKCSSCCSSCSTCCK